MNFLQRAIAKRDAIQERLDEIVAKRDAKAAELDDFAGTLDDENRNATADENELVTLALAEVRSFREQADSVQVELDAAQADVDELQSVDDARSKQPASSKRRPDRRTADDPYDIEIRSAPRTAETRRDFEDRAFKALEQERSLTDDQKTHVDALLRSTSVNRDGALSRHLIGTGRPEYRSAFSKLMRGLPHVTDAEFEALEEVRAINITTDGEGGYLMPFTLDPSIVLVNDGRTNPMRQLATVRTVMTDNWQGVNSAGVTASWDAEASEVSDDTPTFTQPAIPVRIARAFVEYTMEAEDDFAGLATDVTALIGDAMDDLEASGFATGTGTGNQPEGIVTGLLAVAGNASRVQTAGVGAYALADVDALSDAVPDRYDANGVFLMHRAIVTATRNLGDATGDPVTNLASGGPMVLRNRDTYKYSKLDSTVATGNEIAVCGDIGAAYRINDRLGITVERIQAMFDTANNLPNGKRGWFARKRVGAGVVNGNAARVLQVQ